MRMQLALVLATGLLALPAFAGEGRTIPAGSAAGFEYIDTSFENASPLWYEIAPDGTVMIHLLYDHQRCSPNRAAGHIHFQLQAAAGTKLTLEFLNLENIWNGKPGSVAQELKMVVVSTDGKTWKPLATQSLPGDRVRLAIEMPGPRLYVARLEPYRIGDLERLLAEIRGDKRVEIAPIGKTVEGRELEIVRVGKPDAPHRVFIRARAHPWESGGNWVVEGLIRRLLRDDEHARRCLDRYSVSILPMANKDGVARGLTRFNLRGKDLNRDWDRPADPELAPENAALEHWLEATNGRGLRPDLALELHNDGSGLLHISRPPVANLEGHLQRMARLEGLLRKHTWFTEGSTKPAFQNAGTLGEGWLQRYGVDAVIHEFNANWIEGRKACPSAKLWQEYGEGLATVFLEYFDTK